jgi:hypothetical protein
VGQRTNRPPRIGPLPAIFSFTEGKLIRRFVAGLNERDAFSQALAMLRSLPENSGLQLSLLEG